MLGNGICVTEEKMYRKDLLQRDVLEAVNKIILLPYYYQMATIRTV